MTIQETIAEVRNLLRQRATLEDRLERAQSAATSTSTALDGTPRGGSGNNRVEWCALHIVQLKDTITGIDLKLDLYTRSIKHVIDIIPDPSARLALTLRYIQHRPMNEIAQAVNYEEHYIYEYMRKNVIKYLNTS